MATTASKRNTSFKVSSYTRLLTHLSMELRRDDVNNIKFVCLLERGLSASRTDAVRSATDLLLELQKTGLISATNVDFLEEVLPVIKRRDLLSAVRKYKAERKQTDDCRVGVSMQETLKSSKDVINEETTPKDDSCSTVSNLSDEEKLSAGQQDTLACRSRRALPRQKHTLDEVAFWLAKGLEQSGRCRSEVDVKHSAKSAAKSRMPIRTDWFSSTR